MTAQEASALSDMYDAAGVIARELGPVVDLLAALRAAPLEDVPGLVDAALGKARRAYDVAAWIRETYG